jgi:hypothetical protein
MLCGLVSIVNSPAAKTKAPLRVCNVLSAQAAQELRRQAQRKYATCGLFWQVNPWIATKGG